jgi:hypothetical protein
LIITILNPFEAKVNAFIYGNPAPHTPADMIALYTPFPPAYTFYIKAGAREYWIVAPPYKTVRAFAL